MNRKRRQGILRLSCHFVYSKNARLTLIKSPEKDFGLGCRGWRCSGTIRNCIHVALHARNRLERV